MNFLRDFVWAFTTFFWELNKPIWCVAAALHLETRYGWSPVFARAYAPALFDLASESRDEWGALWMGPADAVALDAEYWDGD